MDLSQFANNAQSQQPATPAAPTQPARQQQQGAYTLQPATDAPETDMYGAPINRNNPQDPNNPAPNPNDPQQSAATLAAQLLDPTVDAITEPNSNDSVQQQQPQLNDAFKQLAETITAAQAAATEKETTGNPLTDAFNTAYGDDVDFADMMKQDSDPEVVNKNLQEMFKTKFEDMYTNAITSALSLSQQLIDRKISEFTKGLETQQHKATAASLMAQQLPFTKQPEYSALSQMILEKAIAKSPNNPQLAVKSVEAVFRLNNPALFDKPNNKRFAPSNAPQSQDSGPTAITLESMADFL